VDDSPSVASHPGDLTAGIQLFPSSTGDNNGQPLSFASDPESTSTSRPSLLNPSWSSGTPSVASLPAAGVDVSFGAQFFASKGRARETSPEELVHRSVHSNAKNVAKAKKAKMHNLKPMDIEIDDDVSV
jgi:hypothetical protein